MSGNKLKVWGQKATRLPKVRPKALGGPRLVRRGPLSRLILQGLLGWLAGTLLLSAALADSPPKIPVVASIIPLGDFCRQLGGDAVEVQVLIPPGASPHVFEPPPSVIAKAAQARVFVYIGAGLEPWAAKLLSSRNPEGLAVVEAAQGLPLIQEVAGHHHPHEANAADSRAPHQRSAESRSGAASKSETHISGNPHIWLDPVLAQEICLKIAAALIQVDPERRQTYEANLKNYLKELARLHQEILKRVTTWSLKDYVCFHPAYTYFAKRYGLREVGVIEVAPGREPTPRHLHKIVEAIRHYGIRVVFAEPQLSPRVAEVIAQEAGVKVLMLDPIGGRPPYGENYLQMMRYNLNTLEEAMK